MNFSYNITDQIHAVKEINLKDVLDVDHLKIKEAHISTHFYQTVARLSSGGNSEKTLSF